MKKSRLILKIFIPIILIFIGAYFVWSIQKAKEVSACGFRIVAGESIITIRNGTVARSGDISIGASVGSDNSFNLTFLDGTDEKKINVKECDTLEYKSGPGILVIKVSKIRSSTSWWSWAPGSNNASVELIIPHTVAPPIIN